MRACVSIYLYFPLYFPLSSSRPPPSSLSHTHNIIARKSGNLLQSGSGAAAKGSVSARTAQLWPPASAGAGSGSAACGKYPAPCSAQRRQSSAECRQRGRSERQSIICPVHLLSPGSRLLLLLVVPLRMLPCRRVRVRHPPVLLQLTAAPQEEGLIARADGAVVGHNGRGTTRGRQQKGRRCLRTVEAKSPPSGQQSSGAAAKCSSKVPLPAGERLAAVNWVPRLLRDLGAAGALRHRAHSRRSLHRPATSAQRTVPFAHTAVPFALPTSRCTAYNGIV